MDNPQVDAVAESDMAYEAPAVTELGAVVELTLGSGAADTADMKRYYYYYYYYYY